MLARGFQVDLPGPGQPAVLPAGLPLQAGIDAVRTSGSRDIRNATILDDTPVRVLSPNHKDRKHGKGEKREDAKPSHGGSVEQSNSVGAFGLALNLNKTRQSLTQRQSGRGSSGLQVGGQGAWSWQDGSANAFGLQGVDDPGQQGDAAGAQSPGHRFGRDHRAREAQYQYIHPCIPQPAASSYPPGLHGRGQ